MDCSSGMVRKMTCLMDGAPPQYEALLARVIEVPGDQDTNLNGPVPSGLDATVPAVIALAGRMDRLVVVSPSRIEKSGCASCRVTVCGVGVVMPVTVPMLEAAAAAVLGF